MKNMQYISGVSTLQLNQAICIGCGMCETVCPHGVFRIDELKASILDRDRCMECGACAKNCPVNAIEVNAGVGCASAIIYGWLTGKEPSCDCDGGSTCC